MRSRDVLLVVAVAAVAAVARAQQAGEQTLTRFALVVRPIAKQLTVWDGSVEVSQGEVRSVRVGRPAPRSKVAGSTWEASTAMPNFRTGRSVRQKGALPKRFLQSVENVIYLTLAGVQPDTTVRITTKQGAFEFTPGEVHLGQRRRVLQGNAYVTRLPLTRRIVSGPTQDDFPAVATEPDGSVTVAYMQFTHGAGGPRVASSDKPFEDMSFLSKPTGGDRVMIVRCARGVWTAPEPVTEGGEDLFGVAVAVDADGRSWVFWSRNTDGNWDLFARSLRGGKWSAPLRLTTAPGADVYPVAATDAAGRVWVAWMGFRGAAADILARRQDGAGFGGVMTVSDAPRNQWEPAIATSGDGSVAFAWDSYQKGDYDVYCRAWRDGALGPGVPVSASLRHEARPSIAYDGDGRLWIAHEDSPPGWGKDFGPYDKEGTRLYMSPNRQVTVRVLEDGKVMAPAQPLMAVFGLGAPAKGNKKGKQQSVAPLSAPVVCADASGRVWVAVRGRRGGLFCSAGTVWLEELVSYSGGSWSLPVLLPGTDGLLERRPVFTRRAGGGLLMVSTADGRGDHGLIPRGLIAKELRKQGMNVPKPPATPWGDIINAEIFAHEFGPPEARATAPQLQPVADTRPAEPDAKTRREAADVERIRSYRTELDGRELRIVRGEFHRHTEISGDGGGDGTLQDMWRYGIDAAALDWIGSGDHDNGGGREYSWWITQKTTDVFLNPQHFTPMFTYERSMVYPDGHRNAVFAKRGIRTLPRMKGGLGKRMDDQPESVTPPHTPDVLQFFRYLRTFDGICASHTSATDMGTDWRDWGGDVEPVVEIYQGDRQNYERPGAPRSNTADHSIGGWRPRGFVSRALKKGYRLGFQASSDHISTHISYCSLFVEEPTREQILDAFKKRRVYGATDNIIADVRCQGHFMGEEFETDRAPTIEIKLIGTQPFEKVWIVRNDEYVYSTSPGTQDATLAWTDTAPVKGQVSYYYVRGEQTDGEIVWASPMWIRYTGN